MLHKLSRVLVSGWLARMSVRVFVNNKNDARQSQIGAD